MTRPTRDAWIAELRKSEPAALWALVRRRLEAPDSVGPPLDDRSHEAPETVVVDASNLDDVVRNHLDYVLRDYFTATPSVDDANEVRVIRGGLEIVRRLALYGVSPSIRAWLAIRKPVLAVAANFGLAASALQALAVSQSNTANVREFWQHLIAEGPISWVGVAFAGLRLGTPSFAMALLPTVLERAAVVNADVRPLLLGLWSQSEARPALVGWINTNSGKGELIAAHLKHVLGPDQFKQLQRNLAAGRRPQLFAPTVRNVRPVGDVEAPRYAG